jgi:hypothetical protein
VINRRDRVSATTNAASSRILGLPMDDLVVCVGPAVEVAGLGRPVLLNRMKRSNKTS